MNLPKSGETNISEKCMRTPDPGIHCYHRVPRAQDNSAVDSNLKFQNSANVVTSRHVATNVQDNSAVNFLPKRGDKWVHNNSTVNFLCT